MIHIFVLTSFLLAYIVSKILKARELSRYQEVTSSKLKIVKAPQKFQKFFKLKKIKKIIYEFSLLTLGLPVIALVFYLLGYMIFLSPSLKEDIFLYNILWGLSAVYIWIQAVFFKFLFDNFHLLTILNSDCQNVYVNDQSIIFPVLTLESWWRESFNCAKDPFLEIQFSEIAKLEVLKLTGIKRVIPAYYKITLHQFEHPVFVLRKYLYGQEADFIESFKSKLSCEMTFEEELR